MQSRKMRPILSLGLFRPRPTGGAEIAARGTSRRDQLTTVACETVACETQETSAGAKTLDREGGKTH